MASYKVKKIVLHTFNDINKQWSLLYPKTSGDMVEGRVENSRLFDGYETKDFLPSTFSSYMRVVSDLDKQTPQGMMTKGIVVTNDYDKDEAKAKPNSIWVKGNVFVQNGALELSTKKYVDEIHGLLTTGDYTTTDSTSAGGKKNTVQSGEIYNHLVYRSEKADKLTTPVKINSVVFDGTKDVEIPFYEVTDNPPALKSKLWIKASTHTIYYYDTTKSKWMPTTSVWEEEKNNGIL